MNLAGVFLLFFVVSESCSVPVEDVSTVVLAKRKSEDESPESSDIGRKYEENRKSSPVVIDLTLNPEVISVRKNTEDPLTKRKNSDSDALRRSLDDDLLELQTYVNRNNKPPEDSSRKASADDNTSEDDAQVRRNVYFDDSMERRYTDSNLEGSYEVYFRKDNEDDNTSDDDAQEKRRNMSAGEVDNIDSSTEESNEYSRKANDVENTSEDNNDVTISSRIFVNNDGTSRKSLGNEETRKMVEDEKLITKEIRKYVAKRKAVAARKSQDTNEQKRRAVLIYQKNNIEDFEEDGGLQRNSVAKRKSADLKRKAADIIEEIAERKYGDESEGSKRKIVEDILTRKKYSDDEMKRKSIKERKLEHLKRKALDIIEEVSKRKYGDESDYSKRKTIQEILTNRKQSGGEIKRKSVTELKRKALDIIEEISERKYGDESEYSKRKTVENILTKRKYSEGDMRRSGQERKLENLQRKALDIIEEISKRKYGDESEYTKRKTVEEILTKRKYSGDEITRKSVSELKRKALDIIEEISERKYGDASEYSKRKTVEDIITNRKYSEDEIRRLSGEERKLEILKRKALDIIEEVSKRKYGDESEYTKRKTVEEILTKRKYSGDDITRKSVSELKRKALDIIEEISERKYGDESEYSKRKTVEDILTNRKYSEDEIRRLSGEERKLEILKRKALDIIEEVSKRKYGDESEYTKRKTVEEILTKRKYSGDEITRKSVSELKRKALDIIEKISERKYGDESEYSKRKTVEEILTNRKYSEDEIRRMSGEERKLEILKRKALDIIEEVSKRKYGDESEYTKRKTVEEILTKRKYSDDEITRKSVSELKRQALDIIEEISERKYGDESEYAERKTIEDILKKRKYTEDDTRRMSGEERKLEHLKRKALDIIEEVSKRKYGDESEYTKRKTVEEILTKRKYSGDEITRKSVSELKRKALDIIEEISERKYGDESEYAERKTIEDILKKRKYTEDETRRMSGEERKLENLKRKALDIIEEVSKRKYGDESEYTKRKTVEEILTKRKYSDDEITRKSVSELKRKALDIIEEISERKYGDESEYAERKTIEDILKKRKYTENETRRMSGEERKLENLKRKALDIIEEVSKRKYGDESEYTKRKTVEEILTKRKYSGDEITRKSVSELKRKALDIIEEISERKYGDESEYAERKTIEDILKKRKYTEDETRRMSGEERKLENLKRKALDIIEEVSKRKYGDESEYTKRKTVEEILTKRKYSSDEIKRKSDSELLRIALDIIGEISERKYGDESEYSKRKIVEDILTKRKYTEDELRRMTEEERKLVNLKRKVSDIIEEVSKRKFGDESEYSKRKTIQEILRKSKKYSNEKLKKKSVPELERKVYFYVQQYLYRKYGDESEYSKRNIVEDILKKRKYSDDGMNISDRKLENLKRKVLDIAEEISNRKYGDESEYSTRKTIDDILSKRKYTEYRLKSKSVEGRKIEDLEDLKRNAYYIIDEISYRKYGDESDNSYRKIIEEILTTKKSSDDEMTRKSVPERKSENLKRKAADIIEEISNRKFGDESESSKRKAAEDIIQAKRKYSEDGLTRKSVEGRKIEDLEDLKRKAYYIIDEISYRKYGDNSDNSYRKILEEILTERKYSEDEMRRKPVPQRKSENLKRKAADIIDEISNRKFGDESESSKRKAAEDIIQAKRKYSEDGLTRKSVDGRKIEDLEDLKRKAYNIIDEISYRKYGDESDKSYRKIIEEILTERKYPEDEMRRKSVPERKSEELKRKAADIIDEISNRQFGDESESSKRKAAEDIIQAKRKDFLQRKKRRTGEYEARRQNSDDFLDLLEELNKRKYVLQLTLDDIDDEIPASRKWAPSVE